MAAAANVQASPREVFYSFFMRRLDDITRTYEERPSLESAEIISYKLNQLLPFALQGCTLGYINQTTVDLLIESVSSLDRVFSVNLFDNGQPKLLKTDHFCFCVYNSVGFTWDK